MTSFSVCVLCYGDHTDLAIRCLDPLRDALRQGGSWIQDVRIGLNEVATATRDYVEVWAAGIAAMGHPVYVFEPPRNVYKYPLMRRMFHDRALAPELAELVMWLDDDSYIEWVTVGWWKQLADLARSYAMIGQRWRMEVQGNQLAWCRTQPWFDPQKPPPRKFLNKQGFWVPNFEFCQGAWWVLRRDVIERLNWPVPELRHNGGDSLLGEVLRHQGLPVFKFDSCVRINADDQGQHSHSRRRGHQDPLRIGADYTGVPLSTSHQQFDCPVRMLHKETS